MSTKLCPKRPQQVFPELKSSAPALLKRSSEPPPPPSPPPPSAAARHLILPEGRPLLQYPVTMTDVARGRRRHRRVLQGHRDGGQGCCRGGRVRRRTQGGMLPEGPGAILRKGRPPLRGHIDGAGEYPDQHARHAPNSALLPSYIQGYHPLRGPPASSGTT